MPPIISSQEVIFFHNTQVSKVPFPLTPMDFTTQIYWTDVQEIVKSTDTKSFVIKTQKLCDVQYRRTLQSNWVR